MRPTDADALMDALRYTFTEEENDHRFLSEEWWWAPTVRKVINNAPTLDAVPVVRCKDCEFALSYKCADGEIIRCCQYGVDMIKAPDDFCSNGKRKDCEKV